MSWEKVNLKDYCEFIGGYAFKSSDLKNVQENGNVPIVKIGNLISDGSLDLNKAQYYNFEDRLSQYLIFKGDILLAMTGATVGKIAVSKNDNIYLNQRVGLLRPKNQNLNKQYLFYGLFDEQFYKYCQDNAGGGAQGNISPAQILNYQIPLPPLHIQKQIANILDKADALRKKDQQLLQKYDELAQAIFIDMFGDPVKNEKGWEEDIVINYCDCIVPGRDKPKSFTGNIPWITTNDLIQLGKTKISKSQIGLDNNEIKEVRARKIPKNSVLMTCVGDLGIISIADCEMVVNQQLHAFQCKDLLNEWFLMFNLYYQKNYFYKMASSTTVPYMNKTICNNVPIIIPPLKLQNQFSILYQNILEQQEKLNHQIQYSGHLFQSLLQKAFTGELIHD